MTRQPHKFGTAALGLLALAICGFSPAVAAAGKFSYTNKSNVVVVVQGSSIDANGKPVRGQPHQLRPGETTSDNVTKLGWKTFVIYDPINPQNIYGQARYNYQGGDVAFTIDPSRQVRGKMDLNVVPPKGMPRK
jgi:hypothetical protein